MRTVLLLLLTAVGLTGCVSYRGGTVGADFSSSDRSWGSGTSGVSSGDMPGYSVPGSGDVPRGRGGY